jgi:hypothetical protein
VAASGIPKTIVTFVIIWQYNALEEVLLMNIEKALRIPFAGGFARLAIGALLNLIPFVNLVCGGYLVELSANTIKGREEMPDWDEWGNKFIKGLKVVIITIIYMLIPLALLTVAGAMGSYSSEGLTASVIPGFIAALLAWFILPMSLTHYAATGTIGCALSLRTVFSFIRSVLANYLGIYLFSIVMFFALGILSLIPVLGWIVSILGGFYSACVLAVLFGDAYRRANLTIYGDEISLL